MRHARGYVPGSVLTLKGAMIFAGSGDVRVARSEVAIDDDRRFLFYAFLKKNE